jgi:hypothetical protein
MKTLRALVTIFFILISILKINSQRNTEEDSVRAGSTNCQGDYQEWLKHACDEFAYNGDLRKPIDPSLIPGLPQLRHDHSG